MASEDAVDFLFRSTGANESDETEREAAAELAKELGYLPLALEEAGAFIAENQARVQDYLAAYRRHNLNLLADVTPKNYHHSVATTWDMSFAEVEKISPAAVDLLRLSAFLSPDAIPFELIVKGSSECGPVLSEVLADATQDPLRLNKAIKPLSRYSLIHISPNSQSYSIHRLVQKVLKDRMDEDTRRRWARRTVRAVSRAFPGFFPRSEQLGHWAFCGRLLPHAKSALALVEEFELQSEYALQLIDKLGFYSKNLARYEDAERLFRRSLRIKEKTLGSEHYLAAFSLVGLSQIDFARAQYAAAEEHLTRAIAIWETAGGPEHDEIVIGLQNLAVIYRIQGKYAEAEELLQRAINIRESSLEPESEPFAELFISLGSVYVAQRKYAEAETLFRRALVIQEALGPDQPTFSSALFNMARLYSEQRKYAAAETQYKRALAIREKLVGPDHHSVGQILYGMARFYGEQKKYGSAESHFTRALAIQEKTLGPEHHAVGTTLVHMANLYGEQKKYGLAESLYRRAIHLLEKNVGPEHSLVAEAFQGYSSLLRRSSRPSEAEEYASRARMILEKLDENPRTLARRAAGHDLGT